MSPTSCRCGIQAICMEVKKPGVNRGRWYWRCATGACRFFKWDNSAYSFIKHPTDAYAAIEPYGGITRRPPSIPYAYNKGQASVLPKTTVKVVFLILSQELLGLKVQKNLTIEPVISRIDNIVWNEELNMWTLPATTRDYKNALRSLPTDLPNLQLDIDPLPDFILDNILNAPPQEMTEDLNVISEMELKLVEFVESPIRNKLTEFQREAVRLGIERRGRILYGNENGLGMWEQALALASVYRDEWPAIIMCDKSMCATWKVLLESFLELEHDEICIIDDMNGPLFKEDDTITLKKRKKAAPSTTTAKPVKKRKPYAARMKNSKENGYDSDDSEDSQQEEKEQEEDDESVYQMPDRSNIKFYIASHKKVSNNKSKIIDQGFRVMICHGSHYLKHKDQNQAKNIRKILESQQRAILLSDTALYTLPIDLYTQIETVKKDWVINYEFFIQRYCNPKNTVFGVSVNGKSNMEELNYLLDKYIWYAPKSVDMKSQLPDIVRQPIYLQGDKKEKREIQPFIHVVNSGACDVDEYIEENNLLQKSNAIKKAPLLEYIDYVFETYKRPKIAYLYLDKEVAKTIMEVMKTRKMKITHIDDLENLEEKVAEYNVSQSVQGVLLDMNLEYPQIDFPTVDLVITIDLPHSREKLEAIESLFNCNDRTAPLLIKYLVLNGSIDDYLWSELQIC